MQRSNISLPTQRNLSTFLVRTSVKLGRVLSYELLKLLNPEILRSLKDGQFNMVKSTQIARIDGMFSSNHRDRH